VLGKEQKEGRTLTEERLMVRNKFVGMEEQAIDAIWNKYDTKRTGFLSRAAVKELLMEYLHEVHQAIPQLISNSFRQRQSEIHRRRSEIKSRVVNKQPAAEIDAARRGSQPVVQYRTKQEEIKYQQAKVLNMISNIDKMTDNFIRKMDTNNDGRVEREEFFKTFRTLLYTTADGVDLNPAEEIKIDKDDESFFFDSPVDFIKQSAPRLNFKKAQTILQDLAGGVSSLDLRAQLVTVLQLLEGVEERIMVNEADILLGDTDLAELMLEDDQAVDFVTAYIPNVLELRERQHGGPDTLTLHTAKRNMFSRSHSYSMPSLPSLPRDLGPAMAGSPVKVRRGPEGSLKSAAALTRMRQSGSRLVPNTRNRRADTAMPSMSIVFTEYSVDVKRCLGQVMDWSKFDVFELDRASSGNSLLLMSTHVLERTGLMKSCGLSKSAFAEYITQIQETYRENPYHNHIHAADVVQGVHFFLESDVGRSLSAYLRFAAIFAGAIHDVGHPGTTNNFQINTSSQWAYLYNDTSVLENMHLSEAFILLKRSGFKILRGLEYNERSLFRKTVIEMVLATDMSKHGSHTHALATQIVKTQRQKRTWCKDRESESYKDEVRLFLNTVIHAADLANTARPLHLCREWVERLYEEFYAQGDTEKKLGLKVSPLCDRDKPAGARGQLYFITKIVIPMFASFYMIVPEVKVCMQYLESNLSYWTRESEREGGGRSRGPSQSSKPSKIVSSTATHPINPSARAPLSIEIKTHAPEQNSKSGKSTPNALPSSLHICLTESFTDDRDKASKKSPKKEDRKPTTVNPEQAVTI